MKVDIQQIPKQLGNASFFKATACASSACIVSSFTDSPSISWVALSPNAIDGEIFIDVKPSTWQQKGPLRVDWPYAVALHRQNNIPSITVLFVYNLATSSYQTVEVPEEASVALLLGNTMAAVVLKEGFFIAEFSSTVPRTTILPAKPLVYPISSLCMGKSKELLLCSMHDIQVWRFKVSKKRTLKNFFDKKLKQLLRPL